jgi:hypothetical protein
MKYSFFSFLFALTSISTLSLKAQWSTNPAVNTPISIATDDQLAPKIVDDNAGGAIMVWNDYRNSSTSYIYAQRINAAGYVQWTTDGVMLGKSVSYQKRPAITADGFGGAIISWIDSSSVGLTLFIQRLNASGAAQWTAGGIAVAIITNTFRGDPELLADGSGGAMVTWADNRAGGFTVSKIYVQHINAAGNALLTTNGLTISSNTANQISPKIMSDGVGGAFIVYPDYRNMVDADLYAQHINGLGVVQWAQDGVAIATGNNNQYDPKLVTDGSGGAIIVWQDTRTGIYDIYYQRINASGITQWTSNGVSLSTVTMDKLLPSIVTDGANGFFITWEQFGTGQDFFDVYAQHVNQLGIAQWNTNGNGIGLGLYDQENPMIIGDGVGGAIVTWDGYTGGNNYDIRAQRINASGLNLWPTNGAYVCNQAAHQQFPVLISDGASGAIVAWQDYRAAPYNDIYAQKIGAAGVICTVGPNAPSAITGPVSVCENSTQYYIYSVAFDSNVGSYTWTLPSGWSGASTTNSVGVFTGSNSGSIQVVSVNSCGTSSATTLSVNVKPLPDATVTESNAVLTVTTSGASYQWYTCPNYVFAPGVFYNQTYTATANGDYAVNVTVNGCSNLSSCITVVSVGLNELNNTAHFLNIYPNPNNGAFVVKSDVAGDFTIVNTLGEMVISFKLNESNNYTMPINTLSSGIYVIACTSNNHLLKQRVIIGN